MEWIRPWWRQPDHFWFLSSYLGSRGVQRFTQFMMAAIVVILGAIPLVLLGSPEGPDHELLRAVSVAIAVVCGGMAVMWLRRWPTRRESVIFTVTGTVCIAGACLVQSNPMIGLVGCISFAAMAGYVAFFHSSRHLVVTLLITAATAVLCAWRSADAGDPLAAVANLMVIAVGVIAVPFGGQVLVHLLSIDALKSHTDPLTGLRNRRGFYQTAQEMIRSASGDHPYFSVVMVDLDEFKRVNDTLGHLTGDKILIEVGDTLRKTCGDNGIVARLGGEEFLIAEFARADIASGTAERLRRAIAATPWRVTASLGVASARILSADDSVVRRTIEYLVDAADSAMYDAKRAGGNQIRHTGAASYRMRRA